VERGGEPSKRTSTLPPLSISNTPAASCAPRMARSDDQGQEVVGIALTYEDGIDAIVLRAEPAFKMALERLPGERDLCSQSTVSRLENLPDRRVLLKMGRAKSTPPCATPCRPGSSARSPWQVRPVGSRRAFRRRRAAVSGRC
jgi:hypothetical protein